MSRLHGKDGVIFMSETGGTPTERLGVNNWTLDLKGAADEATGMDSDGAKAFVEGLIEWSGSTSGVWDSTQTSYPPTFAVGNVIDVELYLDNANSFHPFTGTAIITSFKPEATVDAAVKWSMDFQGSETITYPFPVE